MANYIASNNNRFYAAVEQTFANVAPVDANHRLPAVELHAHQQLQQSIRRDKTGTRTSFGLPPLSRRATAFALTTLLTSWDAVNAPGYDPLLQSACGGVPIVFPQTAIAGMADASHITTAAPHGLSVGSAVSQGSEVRFVTAIGDPFSLTLNAPFSVMMAAGQLLAPCMTYPLGNSLPSVSIFDYWDPSTAQQRLLMGATVDSLDVSLNGAFHEMTFSGLAADLVDSTSFVPGTGGLQTFPQEPVLSNFDYSIVAGHLGEACFGTSGQQVFTLTRASIHLKNNLIPRNAEFGAIYPTFFAAGPRDVSISFSLFADDSSFVKQLYVAAKQRATIPVMFQLGRQQGQIMGVYLPQVQLEIPNYDDREPRLIWDFKANFAQGVNNDEMAIAVA